MSRILVGEKAGADEDFGSEDEQMWLIFCSSPIPQNLFQITTIHMDQMILSEPSIVIIWTYMDMMEWMSRMLVGEKTSADEDFCSGNGQIWLIFCLSPRNLIQLTTIHMGQMTLSEPSIIIIWTYQNMMEWMSRMLVGEKADAHVDFGWGDGQMWLIFVHAHKPYPTHHHPHGPDDPFR
jgi:hypothetical protein